MRQRARLLMITIVGVSALILLGGVAALTGQRGQEQQAGSAQDQSSELDAQDPSVEDASDKADFDDEVLTVNAAVNSTQASERSARRSARLAKGDAEKAAESADAAAQSAAEAAALVVAASSPNATIPAKPGEATAEPQAPLDVNTATNGSTVKAEQPSDPDTNVNTGDSQPAQTDTAKDDSKTTTAPATGDSATDNKPDPTPSTAPTGSKSFATDGMANISDRGLTDRRTVKAFPGAEGGGQNSNGGRGGDVVIVDTTDCSDQAGDGKISWKEAWQGSGDVSPGDRVVVFAVGGLFDCGRNTNKSMIDSAGELTVACQTAPWPGVNIAAYRIQYKGVKNVIVRGCQFLNHDISGDTASMFRVVTTGSSSDIIADRITGLHGPDDFTMAYVATNNTKDTMKNITLSNSIIAEGDAYSTHTESTPNTGKINRYQHSHGAGCSAGLNTGSRRPVEECSFIGNLMAHNNRRNPKFFNSSGQVIGNMGYNVGEAGYMVAQREASEIDVWLTDNFFKYGPNTKPAILGNGYIINTRNNATDRVRMERNTYQLPDNGAILDIPDRLDNPKNDRLTFHPVRNWTAQDAFDCLGATHRDANVDRIVQEVRDATGEIGIGTYGNPRISDGDAGRHWLASEGGDANYYPTKSHPSNYDTDSDGMADSWERANGLKVGTKDHNGDLDGDGYTNIEEFVNSLMRCD